KHEPVIIKNHDDAIKLVLSHIPKKDINIVGHRVVHGGEKYSAPITITEDVKKTIKELSSLAPLHNPPNLQGIESCEKLLPGIPQIAVFDTSFHSTISRKTFLYALPYSFYTEHGIRKYGFHGTSHNYIMLETKKLLKKEKINMISCHLGNGSSITAIKNNESVDTSMGFTPLAGIPMGTRSGDIDPGIILHLMENTNFSLEEMKKLLNKESGLLGISGESDMRKIYDKARNGNEKSLLAIDMLAYDLAKYIGSYFAVLGNVDAITFTGGLGENAFYVRSRAIKYLENFGVILDEDKNRRNEKIISSEKSKVKVLVLPTNEELMIARECGRMMK
ncbi:MAG: acetate/propionate family kinase, partial [Candidatus Nanoarchaeia archaeon]